MVRLAQAAEDDISIPESMPSLTPTRAGEEATQQHSAPIMLPDNGSEYEYGYYVQHHPPQYYGENLAEHNSSVEEPALAELEGETVASTASSMTSVRRLSGFSAMQLDESTVDIPFQEQDDPPDLSDWDAASLETDSELEQAGA